jgi:hypothetical protein
MGSSDGFEYHMMGGRGGSFCRHVAWVKSSLRHLGGYALLNVDRPGVARFVINCRSPCFSDQCSMFNHDISAHKHIVLLKLIKINRIINVFHLINCISFNLLEFIKINRISF